jgi:Ca2+-binding RTX toxin-like protein
MICLTQILKQNIRIPSSRYRISDFSRSIHASPHTSFTSHSFYWENFADRQCLWERHCREAPSCRGRATGTGLADQTQPHPKEKTPMATFFGTPGDDNRTGTEQGDNMVGFAGNDTLNGLGGEDTLSGGDDNDSLIRFPAEW